MQKVAVDIGANGKWCMNCEFLGRLSLTGETNLTIDVRTCGLFTFLSNDVIYVFDFGNGFERCEECLAAHV